MKTDESASGAGMLLRGRSIGIRRDLQDRETTEGFDNSSDSEPRLNGRMGNFCSPALYCRSFRLCRRSCDRVASLDVAMPKTYSGARFLTVGTGPSSSLEVSRE